MRTIEQLAGDLEISKTTIYNKLNSLEDKLKDHVKKENGITFVTDEGAEIIKNSISPKKFIREEIKKKQQEQGEEEESKDIFQLKLIETLEKQLEDLKRDKEDMSKQLIAKDNQIEALSKLNENSQVLLGQAQQKIFLLEPGNQNSKNIKSWFMKWFS